MSVSLAKRAAYSDGDIQVMVRAYLECALWSSTGDDGEPLDAVYGLDDLSPECEQQGWDDVDSFVEYVGQQLAWIDPGQAGHDFWLTRNGHGAGFWDRGLGAVGESLTAAAKTFGGVDLYVSDAGLIEGT